MRVIRCPVCDEPLPGFANFCAACGETLTPTPTSTTARISRPRTLKVPHFFAVANEDDLSRAETMKVGERPSHLSPNSTLPLGQRASIGLLEEEIGSGRHANWHKIVEERPPRTPSLPRMSATIPVTPLPSDYLLTPVPPRPARDTQPSLVMWVCTLLLGAIIVGGLFGVVVTLGRGVLAQKPPRHTEITLQVTPASVALGALITLRGTNFSPHGRVGLTRDTTIPIADTGNNTIIQVNAQGSFSDTILVDPGWQAGTHIIHAEDALLHKTASFTILVTGHSSSLRPAHLLLSAGTLDLGAGDQATNSTKTVTLTNAGGGQISWQSATTQPWLLLSPRNGIFSGGQSIQVMVAADRSNLRPGSYAAQVIFTSNAGQATLPVKMKTTTLEPGHEAVLQLTPAVLSFTGTDGSISPPAQVVTVSNPGALPLQWSASTSGGNSGNGWLSVSPLSGSVVKGGSQAVVIRANTSTQLPGIYYAVVTFTSQGSLAVKDNPQSVYISLTILPQCALLVSPGQLAFTGVSLQPGPATKIISLNVTQSCAMQLRWSAATATNNGGHWLNVGSTKGRTPSYPAIGVNVTGLKPGVYTGSIFFSTTVGTQTLPVSLTLAPPRTPIMSATPADLAFSDIIGQPNPADQVITITNTGGGALNWDATATTNFGGAWLSVAPASGYLYAHQSTSVKVMVSLLRGFTSNTYTGMVTITGADNAGQPTIGSPQNIPVNFTVLPACAIAVAPAALSFAGVVGQPNPAAQPASITASGTCPHALNWSASITNASWLTTTPASGSVSLSSPAMTNIGVVLAGLGANTYSGQVAITAVDSVTHRPVGTPQKIAITLTVQPPCMLQAPSVGGETFNSEVGANPNPASQSFTIAIIGACTGNIKITPTSTQSWLAITPPSATISGGSTTFRATVTSASLSVGMVNGSISLAAVDGSGVAITGSPQAVNVTLNVNAPPSLTVSPGSGGLSIHLASGTISQPFSINNTGGEPLNWTAALDSGAPAYVSLSVAAGTNLAGGASTSVDVIVDATGVPGGSTITTSVTVSASDPITGNAVAGSPATIPITITIPPPAMQISTTVLAYSTTVGVNPPSQSIILTNIGGDGLTWSAGTPSQSWLTLDLTSGSDNAGATSTIPFKVDVTGLASGPYTATVVITPSGGSAVMVTVNLVVS